MPKGKNGPAKKILSRNVEPKKKLGGGEEEDDTITEFIGKEKNPVVLDIEEREDVISPVDKMVADPLLAAEDVDSGDSDVPDLDEEELDPFGDKWEG